MPMQVVSLFKRGEPTNLWIFLILLANKISLLIVEMNIFQATSQVSSTEKI